MFVLAKSRIITRPVTVSMPDPDAAGKESKSTFDVKFKMIPQSQFRTLIKDEKSDDIAICKASVVGFVGVTDEDKNPIPFSPENLEELLDEPRVATAIATVYIAEAYGDASRKN